MTQSFRQEFDTMGTVLVPAEKYWGAQTQRALINFSVRDELMPTPIIRSLGLLKKAAALVNHDLGLLSKELLDPMVMACDEVISGKLNSNFPLTLWQTGSGTQTNMNVNEVIANRAIEILGGVMGSKKPVHPNDHVNMGQSSNDSFPTAMHIAAVEEIEDSLMPVLKILQSELLGKEIKFSRIVKVGRTHLMDATPLTLGQEFSGYRSQIELSIERIEQALVWLRYIAQGGTAVGTGLNTHPEFAIRVAKKISELTNKDFMSAPNKFESLASHDALVFAHGAIKTLAVSLIKIANDIRWLGSGPRCGLQELILPENEPGSSIMPGKVNPTQSESLIMVCTQVLGNDVAINIGGASGNFELNVFKPLIITNFLRSVRLLTDSMNNFVTHCLHGLSANSKSIAQHLDHTLMLVTALAPHIGYDKAAQIASTAYHDDISLKAAALKLGYINEAQYDQWINVDNMIGPSI